MRLVLEEDGHDLVHLLRDADVFVACKCTALLVLIVTTRHAAT